MHSVVDRAQAWMKTDPDAKTRGELEHMIQTGDEQALASCFGTRLQFGTAGIRGRMGPGPGRMNRVLVRQVTAGLGAYLLESDAASAKRGVVVGFDGRINSKVFASDVVGVLVGLNIRVIAFDEVVATPVLAHAVTYLGAAAGVMITASHNPPQDNGYKVYWSNGAQIIPPHDSGISAAIDRVGRSSRVHVVAEGPQRSSLLQSVPKAAWDDYQSRVLDWRVHRCVGAQAVYTALHGVGYAPLAKIVDAAGHEPLICVEQQRDPDGNFPTVSFPNPEEPGAMDKALSLATVEGVDVVIAHDPDADRLAVGVPDGSGGWRVLTGNEVGLLLADELLSHTTALKRRMVANTIVSTSLLSEIAKAHGIDLVQTLTGFKWIANAAIDYDGEFIVGFEEALGYSIGDVVRDKDGISAALHILDLASKCREDNMSVLDRLEVLYRKYGYGSTSQRAIVMSGEAGVEQIRAVMASLRNDPPLELDGSAVLRIRDVGRSEVTDLVAGTTHALELPNSDVLAFDLSDRCRVLVRPSGTEPKLKFYFEVCTQVQPDEALSEAMSRASMKMKRLEVSLMNRVGL